MREERRAGRGRRPRRGPAAAAGAAWGLAALVLAAGCGGESSTGPGATSPKVVDLDLSVGESRRITPGGSVLQVNVPGPGDAGAGYRLAVQSSSEAPGSTPVRLSIEPDGGTSSATAASPRVTGTGDRRLDDWVDADGHAHRRRLQRRMLEMLQRRSGPAPDGPGGVREASMLPSNQTPQQGDELEFWFPVDEDGTPECDTDSAATVTATVQAVGQRVAMVEGNDVDDGALEEMDYQALADEFDDAVFGVDVAYFGAPSDIDGNGRVLVLFTNKVNEFSASQTGGDGGGVVSGFFIPADLADSGDPNKDGSTSSQCAAGNEAEVLWLLAPDPDASTGESASVDEATRSARSTASHEFQHLLNLANRLFDGGGGFGDAEVTWLDEGLSHVAEEIVGLAESGVALRQNLTLSDVTGSESQDSIFNTFLIDDFANLARHLKSTADTRALAEDDPDDTQASLRMRGYAWMLLRWLADREHVGQTGSVPGGGDPEEAFFRELAGADGSLETGVANLEASSSATWPEMLGDFGLAMAVDDDEPQAASRHQVLTWNLRDVFSGLNQAVGEPPFDREYPLIAAQNGFTSATLDFSVQAGTGRFVFLSSSGSAQDVTLELTNQAGDALTAGGPQITVIRTR